MSPCLTNLRVHMKTLKNEHIYWLIPASWSLRDLQCCLHLSPNHFWGTWDSSGSPILTLSCFALWRSLITEPWGRHVVTPAGASGRGAWLPCPACCLLGPWVCKTFMVSSDPVASPGLHVACSVGNTNSPSPALLFRFYIPVSLREASVLKTSFSQQLQS